MIGGNSASSQSGKCRGTACRALLPTWLSLLLLVTCLSAQEPSDANIPSSFRVQETTIAQIHAAFEDRAVTCPELVAMYLARIDTYDKQGPSINAIIRVNPRALKRARKLQEDFDTKGLTGPLHCIPMIVKDNYDTADMPTTAGSLSLANSVPPNDAFQVHKIREAGAIVLAKSNMAEFAFSAYQTVGSFLPGHTRNPYDTRYVPAGSSGGTAAAVASNLGAIGLGTDTGNSIRGPSSHTSLVGIRSTMGLTSRDGIVPLNLFADIGGPMARTVEDAVRVFDIIAGYDPSDPVTSASRGKKPASYLDSLNPDALKSARIGVARDLLDDDADPRILSLLGLALADMHQASAEIIDPVHIEGYKELADDRPGCRAFKFNLNDYLKSLGPSAPFKSLTEIIESGKFHPSIRPTLEHNEQEEIPAGAKLCAKKRAWDMRLREVVREAFRDHRLDALVYPTWNNPPRLIGDLNTPHGNNSNRLAPPTGFPAITVPMGFVDGLPSGLQILGDIFSEPKLIGIAYAYEQTTHHRRPPKATP
jgi:Asp-tRNA(Asn)/Glu-tRNA(Gln) amidotransferase A subunit family amidase